MHRLAQLERRGRSGRERRGEERRGEERRGEKTKRKNMCYFQGDIIIPEIIIKADSMLDVASKDIGDHVKTEKDKGVDAGHVVTARSTSETRRGRSAESGDENDWRRR